MNDNKSLSGEGRQEGEGPLKLDRRLMEEITILRIEGTLFCFDPKEAKRRTGIRKSAFTHADGTERPISIEIHPSYGQPSVLAYKVVQAIFLKMTEEGYPYANSVAFTQRELARLVGRTAWGGKDSRELYQAMTQLQSTRIVCSVQNKETKEYLEVNFYFLPQTLFSKKDKSIRECVVWVADPIVQSLNRRHIAYFNLEKLNTLETIGMVLYKRLFFHFSNIYNPSKARSSMDIEKDYEDICCEWLGGLKPEKYISRVHKQLGKHLEQIKATKLIRRYEVKQRIKGKGLKLIFYPGDGFFEDYQEYYIKQQHPRLRFKEAVAVRYIQQPLELVTYFHECMGRPTNTVDEKEAAQVSTLLESASVAEVRELIDYAVAEARTTNFKMQHFGAVLGYRDRWRAERETRARHSKRKSAIGACPFCDESGYMQVKDENGAFRAVECPHAIERITAYEERTGLRRV